MSDLHNANARCEMCAVEKHIPIMMKTHVGLLGQEFD